MTSWAKGAAIGGIAGVVFHLLWHLKASVPLLSQLLWEWGGVFAGVARFELVGLHLLVLVAHVSVYAIIGAVAAAAWSHFRA
ncbi:MAG: hypothetical protein ACE5LU_04285 [Anaerolineae bacterium]